MARVVQAGGSQWKDVGWELRRRSPSAACVTQVREAFNERRIEPWTAAFLLGCIGQDSGYEAVREILAAPDLSSAHGYIATAMIDLDRARAEDDLVRLVEEAPTQEGRDEAAYGLEQICSATGRDALLRAAARGRVRPELAARLLVDWHTSAATVASWFASMGRGAIELGCHVVAIGVRRPLAGPRSCAWTLAERTELLRLAEGAVERGDADPKPYVRTALRRPTRHRLIAMRGLSA